MSYQLQVKTSFVSPMTLKVLPEYGYLPIFIIRNIGNSNLIGKYSGTAIHMRELAPSNELFRERRDNLISFEEFSKKYIIEMSEVNFVSVIDRLNYLANLSDARGVVLMGYGSDDKNCHRSILSGILNNMKILDDRVTELIL